MTSLVIISIDFKVTLSLLLIHLRHRHHIAAEIKQGMSNAKDILDSSDEGIIVTNLFGVVIRFNQKAAQTFGYNAKNILGKDFLMLLPEEQHKAHQNTMSGTAPKFTNRNLELVARRADGTRFPDAGFAGI